MLRVKVTAEEMATIKAEAARMVLSVGAWAGDACMTVAANHGADTDEVLRELLGELMDLTNLTRRAGTNLNQAVARLNATGQAGPDLEPAAEYVMRIADRVEQTSRAVSRRLAKTARTR